jgi:hypothetical protein
MTTGCGCYGKLYAAAGAASVRRVAGGRARGHSAAAPPVAIAAQALPPGSDVGAPTAHVPVLLGESLALLLPPPRLAAGRVDILDATFGGGAPLGALL